MVLAAKVHLQILGESNKEFRQLFHNDIFVHRDFYKDNDECKSLSSHR